LPDQQDPLSRARIGGSVGVMTEDALDREFWEGRWQAARRTADKAGQPITVRAAMVQARRIV